MNPCLADPRPCGVYMYMSVSLLCALMWHVLEKLGDLDALIDFVQLFHEGMQACQW